MTEISRRISETTSSATLRILPIVLFNLVCYIVIGLEMAVVPLFVHRTLGYGTVLAGFAVSAQYLATLATRTWAGNRIDTTGARGVVVTGLLVGGFSSLLLVAAAQTISMPLLSLLLVLAGRFLLGFSESWVAVGVIIWNIYRAGAERTALVISWNGVCSYGGIALGAPIATMIFFYSGALGGLTGVGLLASMIMLVCVPFAARHETTKSAPKTKAPSFMNVIRAVMPFGVALAAGSIGFGAIASCLALYFDAEHWSGAATALALFGILFVITRFFGSHMIARIGGASVAAISMGMEALGLFILAWGQTPLLADLGAALTGIGFSLVFPALGVEAVGRLGPANRGAALGGFSVFLDLAIGISGPGLGMIIPIWGFSTLFMVAALFSIVGVGLSFALKPKRKSI
ncbi:MFS transporter [Acetobacter fallax]|uniref:MFS transporter n=1 Tax=Acetobacter fallax TaxID=1737473 RepID=A0ABX0KAI0_9PROT|nr:MFS transporter [Acetobacter fallax]NHO33442.1 MFS transporter [Acetobacter fallax]NHO37079.1 MFS transporter [Acetobacter fallax]